MNFFVVQDHLIGTFKVSNPLIYTKIQFRLIKVDNWNPNDFLDVYINDLRVIHKSYTNKGNKICFIGA